MLPPTFFFIHGHPSEATGRFPLLTTSQYHFQHYLNYIAMAFFPVICSTKTFISSHWLISYTNIIISLSSLYPIRCSGMVSCHLVYQYFGQHFSEATGSFPALQTSHYSVVPFKKFPLRSTLDLCVAGTKGVVLKR